MKLKFKALIAIGLTLALSAAFAGCTDNPGGGENNDDYGTLTIEDPTVYITESKAYTFAEIEPIFSKPDKAEQLAYTYDTGDIKIENGVVTPLKRADKRVNVRAKSENFNVVFGVEIKYLRFEGQIYNTSEYESAIASRIEQCKAVTKDTTLFIGDSFIDEWFIGDYMQTYAQDKEIICAGIGGTTSYQWEAAYRKIMGATAPKNIVLNLGVNNFYNGRYMAEDTIDSLTRLFMFLHSSYPASNIYWFNIIQSTNSDFISSSSRVTETNGYMADWCGKFDWINSIDVCSKINESDLREDKLHPKTESYDIFTNALAEAGCVIVNKNR